MTALHWIVAELTKIRLRDGVSRTRVGDRVGRSEGAVGSWERGENEPSLAQVEVWAALHGLKLVLVPDRPGARPVSLPTPGEDLIYAMRARTMCASGEARRIRKAAGLSLRDAAGAIGADNKTLFKWESGECVPTAYYASSYGRLLEALQREVAS